MHRSQDPLVHPLEHFTAMVPMKAMKAMKATIVLKRPAINKAERNEEVEKVVEVIMIDHESHSEDQEHHSYTIMECHGHGSCRGCK